MKIILASGSPRRKELLNLIIPEFEVKVSEAEEILDDNIEPEEQATQLAHLKAKEVFEKTQGDRIVIGAWGGDFFMAATEWDFEKTKDYFENKGLNVVLKYKDIVL